MSDVSAGSPFRLHQMSIRTYLWVNFAFIAVLFVGSMLSRVVIQNSTSELWVFLAERFYHSVEFSLPTFYNYGLIVANFALLSTAALGIWAQRGKDLRYWIGLAGVFLYLGYDEAARVHERLVDPMDKVLPDSPFLEFGWTPIGLAFALVVGLICLPFLRRLPVQVARLMVLAGATYVFGAVGVETIGGWLFYHGNFGTTIYHVAATIEETFEMSGMVIFGYAVLVFLSGPGNERAFPLLRS
jgi:hypothetical protein